MRAVVQRVTDAAVEVAGEQIANIGRGLLVLLAVGRGDGERQAKRLANKIASLRVFAVGDGRFSFSACDVGAEVLVVSQFTLYAETRGRRPSFTAAAPPEDAAPLIDRFCTLLREMGLAVATGRFGATMLVKISNDGPVTIIIDEN